MKKYVLDASFILSVLISKSETASRRFKIIFSQYRRKKAAIYSSPLLLLEIANGLRFSATDEKIAYKAYDEFSRLPIELLPLSTNQIKEIMKWSYEMKTTIYDTSYHFAAKLINGTLLTCDSKYYNYAKIWGQIELIS